MTTTSYARAWSVARKDGLILGFTDHDDELRFDEIRFRPDAGLSARAIMQGSGLSVDNSEAEGVLSDDAITARDILAGLWDAAEVQIWEVNWRDVGDRRVIFVGTLGEITRSSGSFRAELRGLTEALNQPKGRVFHPRCAAVLGDQACRFDLRQPGMSADWTINSVEHAGMFQFVGGDPFDARWFERGVLTVLSGSAKGLSGVIKNDRSISGQRRAIELWSMLGIVPLAGDRVRLTAGCDKASTTCRLKFNNIVNFRGFPHLPSEDWLMAPQTQPRPADPGFQPNFAGSGAVNND